MNLFLSSVLSVASVAAFWAIYIYRGKAKTLEIAREIQSRVNGLRMVDVGSVLHQANMAISHQFSFSADAEQNIKTILDCFKRSCREHFLQTDFDNFRRSFAEIRYDDFFIASFYEYLDPVYSSNPPSYFPKRYICSDFGESYSEIQLYDEVGPDGMIPNTMCLDLYKLYLAVYRIAANNNLIQGYRDSKIVEYIKMLEAESAGNNHFK